MKVILTLLILTIVAVSAGADPKDDEIIFQLISVSQDSDIKTSFLKKIADAESAEEMENGIKKLFNPVNGASHVYSFRAAFWGVAKFRTEKEIFHDVLILSVSEDGVILDGFSYTEEWGELPYFSDLYRVSAKDVVFKDLVDVSQLKLKSAVLKDVSIDTTPTGVIDHSRW